MKITRILKIIPAFILAGLMCTSAFASDDVMMDGGGFFDPEVVEGDVNLDGSVDARDAILVLLHSMYPGEYPISYAESIDFTGDGKIDINDAVALLRYSIFPEIYPLS